MENYKYPRDPAVGFRASSQSPNERKKQEFIRFGVQCHKKYSKRHILGGTTLQHVRPGKKGRALVEHNLWRGGIGQRRLAHLRVEGSWWPKLSKRRWRRKYGET